VDTDRIGTGRGSHYQTGTTDPTGTNLPGGFALDGTIGDVDPYGLTAYNGSDTTLTVELRVTNPVTNVQPAVSRDRERPLHRQCAVNVQ